MLFFSEEEIKAEFPLICFDLLETTVINLNEGPYHQGKGVVIRFIGTKHEKNN
ncbi:hypothetical protein [Flavobacterium piscinae]|uniref:hypothetical protein n=1 Tax=Flavobacterium piscinae TaxID=2506424 RepID=UPI002AAAB946|nr:hypothetical protein [Flavobacterium piscinae]